MDDFITHVKILSERLDWSCFLIYNSNFIFDGALIDKAYG